MLLLSLGLLLLLLLSTALSSRTGNSTYSPCFVSAPRAPQQHQHRANPPQRHRQNRLLNMTTKPAKPGSRLLRENPKLKRQKKQGTSPLLSATADAIIIISSHRRVCPTYYYIAHKIYLPCNVSRCSACPWAKCACASKYTQVLSTQLNTCRRHSSTASRFLDMKLVVCQVFT